MDLTDHKFILGQMLLVGDEMHLDPTQDNDLLRLSLPLQCLYTDPCPHARQLVI